MAKLFFIFKSLSLRRERLTGEGERVMEEPPSQPGLVAMWGLEPWSPLQVQGPVLPLSFFPVEAGSPVPGTTVGRTCTSDLQEMK